LWLGTVQSHCSPGFFSRILLFKIFFHGIVLFLASFLSLSSILSRYFIEGTLVEDIGSSTPFPFFLP